MFDPSDDKYWAMGSQLNWWDSTLGYRPAWLTDPTQARQRLQRRLPLVLRALALIHEHRTVETSQLHALDPQLPANPRALIYMDMASMGLVDVGYPLSITGRASSTPGYTPFTAWRLPIHTTIEPVLDQLGCTPMQTAAIGPGPLRGARQYDRHNLMCATLSITARQHGWRTVGELYGRFSLLTGDPLAGHGGPDVTLIGEHLRVCVELTASANFSLTGKFARWDRMLAYEACADTHVVWVNAARTDSLLTQLEGLCRERARHHAADWRVWRDRLETVDGFTPSPGAPRRADGGWAAGELARMVSAFGLDGLDGWRIPAMLDPGVLYD